jgi:hypothetical protein
LEIALALPFVLAERLAGDADGSREEDVEQLLVRELGQLKDSCPGSRSGVAVDVGERRADEPKREVL